MIRRSPDSEFRLPRTPLEYEREDHPLTNKEKEVLEVAQEEERNRPKISDFKHEFDAEEIRRDKQRVVDQRRKNRETTGADRGTIAEYIILDQVERSDWFGPAAVTFQTTEFDDYVNHVDGVIKFQFEENGPAFYLAIDVTTSRSDSVNKKQKLIQQEVASGQLATVKYYESPPAIVVEGGKPETTRGSLQNIPRVVLALSREDVQSLSYNFRTKKPMEMAKSPDQLILLQEVHVQMMDQIEMSFNALLNEVSNKIHSFKGDEKSELIEFLKAANGLAQNPESLPQVLEIFNHQKNLQGQLSTFPEMQVFLEAIEKQSNILEIFGRLIKEKSDLLGQTEAHRVADRVRENVVVRQTAVNLHNFSLPPDMQNLAQVA